MVRPGATTAAGSSGSPGPEGRLGGPAAPRARVLSAPPPSPRRRYTPSVFGEPAPRRQITAHRSSSLPQVTMAEFTQQSGKRRDDGGLGSVLDLLLANARLVLGVSGAAVLAIATLAVKRVRLGGVPTRCTGHCATSRFREVPRCFHFKTFRKLARIFESPKPLLFTSRRAVCDCYPMRVLSPALGLEVLPREQLVRAGFPCRSSVSLLFQQYHPSAKGGADLGASLLPSPPSPRHL